MSRSDSFRGGERTAKEVHATLCAMVTTQASFSAWSAYESVLLDPCDRCFLRCPAVVGTLGRGVEPAVEEEEEEAEAAR